MEQDERELPTIREIEFRIWRIGKSSAPSTDTQLEACQCLIGRIRARETDQRHDKRELPEEIRKIESQIWEIANPGSFGTTQLRACQCLIGRIEAREQEGRGVSEEIRKIESQIWEIAKSSLFGTTHLSACKILIGRIEARENAGPKLITVEFVKTGEAEAAEKDTGGGLNVDPERKHER